MQVRKKVKIIPFVLENIHLRSINLYGGWGNGYVAISKNHPHFGKHYHDLNNIHVHGGLTFSGGSIHGQPPNTKGMWIFGFNTHHYPDTLQR